MTKEFFVAQNIEDLEERLPILLQMIMDLGKKRSFKLIVVGVREFKVTYSSRSDRLYIIDKETTFTRWTETFGDVRVAMILVRSVIARYI